MVQQVSEGELVVRYEGLGSGAGEIWGGTQANFTVAGGRLPAAREVAVMLNDPAAALLAEAAGRENNEQFQAEAAKLVGEAAIRKQYERMGRVDAIVTVSARTLENHADLLEAVRG